MNSPTSVEEPTLDAFLNGAFHLLQPSRSGFRAGHDALLLAACVERGSQGGAIDMGAGAGAVSFAAAFRAPALSLTLAEQSPFMTELAERSRGLEGNRALAGRLDVRCLDLLGSRTQREAAGLQDGAFDLILTNPPFHPAGGRVSPDALRGNAKSLPNAGFLRHWLAVAGALCRHRGRLLMIARPENLAEILSGVEGRFGGVAFRSVHSAPNAPAQRLLVSASRGSRAPVRMLPSLVLDADLRGRLSRGEVDIDL